MEFLPSGFLQMILPGHEWLRSPAYKFDYVRRDFLAKSVVWSFDVDPLTKSDKGRFVGRIWVEDRITTSCASTAPTAARP